jgi:hypothetical protein
LPLHERRLASVLRGPAEKAGVGRCARGTQSCSDTELGTWGVCEGWTAPEPETCNELDDDCDGSVDEGCVCEPGTTRACSAQPPDDPDHFVCGDGTQTCVSEQTGGSRWGRCEDATICRTTSEQFTYGESEVNRPVDIVMAVDQSGSMDEEIENVRDNLNAYSTALEDSGIDYTFTLIAERGQHDNEICIPEPLGGPNCSDTSEFHQIDDRVASTNALELIEEHITTIESYMREGSLRVFTVVTDDNSHMPATEFDSFLQGREGYEDYIFDGIVAEEAVCEGTADNGDVYIELADMTGGQIEHVCDSDWSESFDRFAGEIISRTLQYELSQRPQDPSTLEVHFEQADGTQVRQPRGDAWHYDTGNNAIVLHEGYTPPDGTPIVVSYAVAV